MAKFTGTYPPRPPRGGGYMNDPEKDVKCCYIKLREGKPRLARRLAVRWIKIQLGWLPTCLN